MSTMAGNRHAERVLNVGPGPPEDGKDRRWDLCPKCGAQRWELLVVPDRFFCDKCQVATVGPNTEPPSDPEPKQASFFDDTADEALESELAAERAPIDEGMAWVGEEAPDE